MAILDKVKVLKWSLYAISSVVLIEFVGGMLANSLVVISDAAHASLDAITTLWLLYATRLSMKPPDKNHTYGHGKIETLGGQFGGIALLGIASLLFYESIIRLFQGSQLYKEFTAFAFLAVIYTLCIDVFRIYILKKVSGSSISARANFFHAFADFSSTIVAILGLSLSSLGYAFTDALSSLVLSSLLGFLSFRLIYSASMELSDIAPTREYMALESLLKNIEGLKGFKALRMRKVGNKYFIDVTVLLSSTIDIERAHSLASSVEEKIRNLIKNSTVMVHYEPIEEELPFPDKIEKIVLKNRSVKGVHQIVSTKTEEGIFITLHIEVDPVLSLSDAHKVSEKIENDIKILLPGINKTTVHIESTTRTNKGEMVYEEKDVGAIYRILNTDPKIKKVSSVRIYKSQGNRYVDIICSFTGTDQIEEVHKEVSFIESEIKKAIGECIVTLHPEPF